MKNIGRKKSATTIATIIALVLGSWSFNAHADVEEIECLAQNIYYEARGEGRTGMIAVGYVTMNRVNHKAYPDSVCGVVHQKTKLGSKLICQFSWVCNRNPAPIKSDLYSKVVEIAETVYNQEVKDPTKGATHFHSIDIEAKWAATKRVVAQIGNHIFYRK